MSKPTTEIDLSGPEAQIDSANEMRVAIGRINAAAAWMPRFGLERLQHIGLWFAVSMCSMHFECI